MVIDQFEEIFTLCNDEGARRLLIDNVLYATNIAGGRTIVVLTMRADFYGQCASYPGLRAAFSDHQSLIGPPREEEFRETIEAPTRLAGGELEPGLLELLLTDMNTFARIGAVMNLKVEDHYPSGKRFLLRFKEKAAKRKSFPVHHNLEELLDQYLKATGLEKEPEAPLFPAAIGKTGKLSRRPLVRTDAADMLKRRLKQAGLPAHYSPHSFRATGFTNYLENDGNLEAAQRIAGHADSRTTKLYDRRGQKVLLEDMERIRY